MGVVNLTPHRFTPRERVSSTRCVESWVNLTAGLDALEKTKISCHCREWNPDSSVDQLVDWSLYGRRRKCRRLLL
jgi:hypothetical protein